MTKPLALIIEDDGDLAYIYARAVRAAGFEVEMILGGRAASQRLAAVKPDLVILDLYLPTITGVEILDQIRTDERLKDTPVIIATADNVLADNLCREVNGILIKPISHAELRKEAARFLNPDASHS
ncbi:MAG: response regulator [Thermoflexales bacterium]|nr:response regulator [Thermoflexales bacterium]